VLVPYDEQVVRLDLVYVLLERLIVLVLEYLLMKMKTESVCPFSLHSVQFFSLHYVDISLYLDLWCAYAML
jgi:hypothetical protein